MANEGVLGPPAVRRRLAALSHRGLNFDLEAIEHVGPGSGWNVDDRRQALAGEPPGMPVRDGSWEIARRLMRGYAFADPSIVRAYYDPATPLAERDMLLELRALRVLHLFVGVRVGEVYEQTRQGAGGPARVWGWNYRTLEGHVEMGQMDWQVWKWLDTGEVEFRVHAVSRPAPIANPFVRIGFRVLRRREREAFLQSTCRRMRALVDVAVESEGQPGAVRDAAAALVARSGRPADAVHDELAANVTATETQA